MVLLSLVTMTTTESVPLLDALEQRGDGEVSASWLAKNLETVELIDVREPHELTGPLGSIPEAKNVPLLQLVGNPGSVESGAAVALICRSGRRSSMAAEALRQAGHEAVASVEGGMLAWNLDVLGKHGVHEDEKIANTHNLSEAVFRTNGLPEVSAGWVQKNLGRFRLIDIRGGGELQEFGRVAQAEHIEMQAFVNGAKELDHEAPMVVMCASGGRSGRVVSALETMGFSAVASLEGGLFGWRSEGLPTV